jgi:hypothetical protein
MRRRGRREARWWRWWCGVEEKETTGLREKTSQMDDRGKKRKWDIKEGKKRRRKMAGRKKARI